MSGKSIEQAVGEVVGSGWEIYSKPAFNGHFPRLVMLRPDRGAVFVVERDWSNEDARAISAEVDRILDAGPVSLMELNRLVQTVGTLLGVVDEAAFRIAQSLTGAPVASALYLPEVTSPDVAKKVESAVGRLVSLRAQDTITRRVARVFPQLAVLTSDTLSSREALVATLPVLDDEFGLERIRLSQAGARALRPFLIEPDVSVRKRQPLQLDARQRELTMTRRIDGRRRITGPAGTGKSLVLAGRAAQLATEGKKVLVLTFNKTLWHYLHGLFHRHLAHIGGSAHHAQHVTFNHLHGYMRTLCRSSLSTYSRYKELFAERGEDDGPPTESIVELAVEALRVLANHRYDAILIDEGQDWDAVWWPVIEASLSRGGECLLVEDVTQDLYGRADSWSEDHPGVTLASAGFDEQPVHLDIPYRLHPETAQVLRAYAEEYLEDYTDLPDIVDARARSLFVRHRCVLTTESRLRGVAVEQVAQAHTYMSGVLAMPDVYLVCPLKKLGLDLVERIENSRRIKVLHTFDDKKEAFWDDGFPVKASTPHSIKGWESRAVVAVFPRLDTGKQRLGLYIAMSRLLAHDDGSVLTIVTTDESFAAFAARNGMEVAG